MEEGTVPEKGLIPQPCSCSEVKNEGTVAQSSACFMCSARNNIEKELVGYLPLEQLLCPPPSQLSSSGRTTCVAVHPSTPPGDGIGFCDSHHDFLIFPSRPFIFPM